MKPCVDLERPPTTNPSTSGGPSERIWSDRPMSSVTSLHFRNPRSFDGQPRQTSQASGFVVDAKRGYILTNRHVVGPGPFLGHCIFNNNERADVFPVYYDPVHDFGFLKFDPEAIKHMKVEELLLRPEGAKVGVEIRVIGNDAGEQLSILSGVISRLDRNAPEYDIGEGYRDFNTSYIQASASATGGSSGSPVVNIDGHAVALAAGGRADNASTDYFLPLYRPRRALRCLQEGKPITRGDIQCQFWLKPFHKCRKLGLRAEQEAVVREAFPQETNMLVVKIVLPEGPSDGKIKEGDVLFKVNGELLTQFIRLDDILDSSVGQRVKLSLLRHGEVVEADMEVGDLHKITPDRFVSVSGGSFHALSYQQASLHNVACTGSGVYASEAGGSFSSGDNRNGFLVQSLNYKKTPDLDTFIKVVGAIPDKAQVVVQYMCLDDPHTLHTAYIMSIDRHWGGAEMTLAVRNDKTGLWDFSHIADVPPPIPPVPRTASFSQPSSPVVANLARSFVIVNCTMPLSLDGFLEDSRGGMGLVIDAEMGLVVISRATVPHDLCDISLVIAQSIIVEGKVVFSHPLQNYTIIQYNPSLVNAPVLSARLSSDEMTQGDDTTFIGYNGAIVHARTTVTKIYAFEIPADSRPRYRAANVDAISVATGVSKECGSGVLVDEDGIVQALWLTYLGEDDDIYYRGLAAPRLLPVISRIREGIFPKLRMLPAQFVAIKAAQAHIMGVSDEWINKVSEANNAQPQLLLVTRRTWERHGQASGLLVGDIILTLGGSIITKMSDLDVMYSSVALDAVILREGEELSLKLTTLAADDVETDRAVSFCGAIIQQPHHAVRQQVTKLVSELYVSAIMTGSPASQSDLQTTDFITHVDNYETPNLELFLDAVARIRDNPHFCLRVVSFNGAPSMVTIEKDEHYFPTTEWNKDSNGNWRNARVKHAE